MRFGPRSLNLADPVDREAAWNPSNVWFPLPHTSGSTTLFDPVGRNHGTLTNGPTWGGEPDGRRAVRFDGSDDYATFAEVSGTAHTWAVRFLRERTGSYEELVGHTSDNNRIGLSGFDASSITVKSIHDNSTWDDAHVGSRGAWAWQTAVVAWVSGVSTQATLNGVTLSKGSGQSGTSKWARFGNGFQGSIQSAWYWPVALSDSQAVVFCQEADAGFPTLFRRVSPVSWFVGGGAVVNRRRRLITCAGG